jgi:hypothetical protein
MPTNPNHSELGVPASRSHNQVPSHFLVPGAEQPHPIEASDRQPHPIEASDSRQQLMEEEEATQNNELFRYTYSIPDLNELHDLIRHMRSNAAPGPDGLNAAFYKSAWSWIQQDIQKLVTDFYTYAHMPTEINQTFITLIPKKNQPTTPQDYRPISLCNVIYKIISKSLANRLKNHLPNYVSHAQSAFIAHRHISSNIIITQEIIHSFNLKS